MRAKEIITEINMSPGNLEKFAKSPAAANILTGFEAEVILQGDSNDDEDGGFDYDADERISRNTDMSDVRQFFELGRNDHRSLSSLSSDLDDYISDQYEKYVDLNKDDYEESARKENPDMTDDEIENYIDEQMTEAYYNGGDCPTFYEFCEAKHLGSMLDLHEQYNLDWPYMISSEDKEFSGDEYASSFNNALDVDVIVSPEYGARRKEGKWYLEPDGSITPDGDGEFGCEIISPPMPLLQMLDKMKETLEWVKHENGYTNDSCGLHIGLSITGLRADKDVDWVKLALFLGDEHILKIFGREMNTYAKSSLGFLRNRTKTYFPAEKTNLILDNLKKGLIDATVMKTLAGYRDRYVTLNVNGDYIELRSMGNDYLNKYEHIRHTVLKFARAYSIAADPEAEKHEYMLKLSKLINPGKDDSLTPFVQYAAGQIGRNQLLDLLHDRKIEKKYPGNDLHGMPTIKDDAAETMRQIRVSDPERADLIQKLYNSSRLTIQQLCRMSNEMLVSLQQHEDLHAQINPQHEHIPMHVRNRMSPEQLQAISSQQALQRYFQKHPEMMWNQAAQNIVQRPDYVSPEERAHYTQQDREHNRANNES